MSSNPYVLEKMDLGRGIEEVNNVGLGLKMEEDLSSKSSIASTSKQLIVPESSSFDQNVINRSSIPPRSTSSTNAPPRPKRRLRNSNFNESENDLDFQIEAALTFVSKHGMSTNDLSSSSSSNNDSSSIKSRSRRRLNHSVGRIGVEHSNESIRLRNDFRKALTRINEQNETDSINLSHNKEGNQDNFDISTPSSSHRPIETAKHSTNGLIDPTKSNGSVNKSLYPTADGDSYEDFRSLLKQARILSQVPTNERNLTSTSSTSNNILRTPPTEAIKKAINNPTGNRQNGINTSASTPEGALGRISLPPSDWGILEVDNLDEDIKRISINDSIKEVLIGNEESEKEQIKKDKENDLITPKVNNINQFNTQNSLSTSESTNDSDALRAGLRFVLGCYDELSNRVNENANISNAIISTIAKGQNGHSITPPLPPSSSSSNLLSFSSSKKQQSQSNSKEDQQSLHSSSTTTTSNQRNSIARLRSGSILRALAAKRKSNSGPGSGGSAIRRSFDQQSKGFFSSPFGSNGLNTPLRSTQMNFDESPEHVIGPSNRLGMADVIAWSPTEEIPPVLKSIGSSTKSNQDENNTTTLLASLKLAKEETKQAKLERIQMMEEIEQMSEQLFTQANEMVKEERIKSSALEKELESLKLAMVSTKESNIEEEKEKAVEDQQQQQQSQKDHEAMMLTAVAEVSRQYAEAEEELQEWRKHCEELEARVEILEEALYNSMNLLARQEENEVDEVDEGEEVDEEEEGEKEVEITNPTAVEIPKESIEPIPIDSYDEPPSRGSLIIPQKAFSESSSSFFSVGEQSPINLRSPEVKLLSTEVEEIVPNLSNEKKEILVESDNQSKDDIEHDRLSKLVELRNQRYSMQTEVESVASSSASSVGTGSNKFQPISPRSSAIASKRQSRQGFLPPRLPEPSSPLPNIPKGETNSRWSQSSMLVQENNNDNEEIVKNSSLLSPKIPDRTSVLTTSRSSSNVKHDADDYDQENDDNLSIDKFEDAENGSENEIQKVSNFNVDNNVNDKIVESKATTNGFQKTNINRNGIKTEPIEQLSTFTNNHHDRIDLNPRKQSLTNSVSSSSSPMLQTPPLITASMINSPYDDNKVTTNTSTMKPKPPSLASSSSKRESLIPSVVLEEDDKPFGLSRQLSNTTRNSILSEEGSMSSRNSISSLIRSPSKTLSPMRMLSKSRFMGGGGKNIEDDFQKEEEVQESPKQRRNGRKSSSLNTTPILSSPTTNGSPMIETNEFMKSNSSFSIRPSSTRASSLRTDISNNEPKQQRKLGKRNILSNMPPIHSGSVGSEKPSRKTSIASAGSVYSFTTIHSDELGEGQQQQSPKQQNGNYGSSSKNSTSTNDHLIEHYIRIQKSPSIPLEDSLIRKQTSFSRKKRFNEQNRILNGSPAL